MITVWNRRSGRHARNPGKTKPRFEIRDFYELREILRNLTEFVGADEWKATYKVPEDCAGGQLRVLLESKTRVVDRKVGLAELRVRAQRSGDEALRIERGRVEANGLDGEMLVWRLAIWRRATWRPTDSAAN